MKCVSVLLLVLPLAMSSKLVELQIKTRKDPDAGMSKDIYLFKFHPEMQWSAFKLTLSTYLLDGYETETKRIINIFRYEWISKFKYMHCK